MNVKEHTPAYKKERRKTKENLFTFKGLLAANIRSKFRF